MERPFCRFCYEEALERWKLRSKREMKPMPNDFLMNVKKKLRWHPYGKKSKTITIPVTYKCKKCGSEDYSTYAQKWLKMRGLNEF
jgi:hypothetical protein